MFLVFKHALDVCEQKKTTVHYVKTVLKQQFPSFTSVIACADPEGTRGSGPPPPLKNRKNIGFSSNTGPVPLKTRSYEASIQCWAIIGTPAKRRFAGGLMMVRS